MNSNTTTCHVIPAQPGYDVVLAGEDKNGDGKIVGQYPVIVWKVEVWLHKSGEDRDWMSDTEPISIGVGSMSHISNRWGIFNRDANEVIDRMDDGEVYEGVLNWLISLGGNYYNKD